MRITEDFLMKGMSPNGGWTQQQLKLLRVGWPPPQGWKRWAIGREISESAAKEFLALQEKTIMKVKKLSREKELEILANTRKLAEKVDRDPSVREELTAWFDEVVDDNKKLDLTRSEWDARAALPERGDEGQRPFMGNMNTEIQALYVAASMRCLQNSCKHIATDFRIIRHTFLAPRILCCESCIPQFMDAFIAHDLAHQHDGECDLCMKQNVQEFRKMQTALHGSMYYGDICNECWELVCPTKGIAKGN